MKQLIDESKEELEDNKTKHQTLVDWSSLTVQIIHHEKEQAQLSLFNNQHYNNKKPKKNLNSSRNKNAKELQIINERSYEETEHKFKKIPPMSIKVNIEIDEGLVER